MSGTVESTFVNLDGESRPEQEEAGGDSKSEK